MLVFLWAALTYPRPSKTFWILLIAYTQIIVAIKFFSQFDIIWWNSNHNYIELLGTNKQNNFAVYELVLLMVVFFHRAVLMTFGVWTSAPKYEFEDGSFQIEKSDSMTSKIIRKSLSAVELIEEIEDLEFKIDIDGIKSSDQLIIDQEKARQSILVKHELATDYDGDNGDTVKLRGVFMDQTDLIHAHEDVVKDKFGNYGIELHQENVKLKLRPIDSMNTVKIYTANQLVTVENSIEEILDFFPSVTLLSIKRYFFITSNLLDLIRTKQDHERKRIDVYKYMFFCEFLNFLVLLFGFMEFVVSIN